MTVDTCNFHEVFILAFSIHDYILFLLALINYLNFVHFLRLFLVKTFLLSNKDQQFKTRFSLVFLIAVHGY